MKGCGWLPLPNPRRARARLAKSPPILENLYQRPILRSTAFGSASASYSHSRTAAYFSGHITNETGTNSQAAAFEVSVYDAQGRLILSFYPFLIMNLDQGKSRAYSERYLSQEGRDASAATKFEIALTASY